MRETGRLRKFAGQTDPLRVRLRWTSVFGHQETPAMQLRTRSKADIGSQKTTVSNGSTGCVHRRSAIAECDRCVQSARSRQSTASPRSLTITATEFLPTVKDE